MKINLYSIIICVSVSYTHLRAHETVLDLVCRLLLEKKKKTDIHAHIVLELQALVSHRHCTLDITTSI